MTIPTTNTVQITPASEGRARVLSGMRPTGRLHLGNYMGALYNWVKLQHEYECYFFIADYHALTTDYADTSRLQENITEVVIDFLSAGLDPEICHIFIQSDVPAHAELHLLLSMITPLSWLERVPTYKDQQEQLKEKDLATYGFLGYPLLQSADILLYKPQFVPVGLDQAAHVEITREIARRFNSIYSSNRSQEILPEPDVHLTPSPKLPGTDGRKMSKSYRNTILLSDHPEEIRRKLESMTNGGQRPTSKWKGDPEICPVADLHAVFSSPERNQHIRDSCRTAAITCLECKGLASDSIITMLTPIQRKRRELEERPELIEQVLEKGRIAATRRAESTMKEVREAMGLSKSLFSTPVEPSVKRAFLASQIPTIHNLGHLDHLWDAEPAARDQGLRKEWLDAILPREIILKRDSDQVFITPSKKRVYVATSQEQGSHQFEFRAKPKSYESLTLLCWIRNEGLIDFIVPQKVYVEEWSRQKRLDKEAEIEFRVTKINDYFYFEIDHANPVNISEFQSNYQPLK